MCRKIISRRPFAVFTAVFSAVFTVLFVALFTMLLVTSTGCRLFVTQPDATQIATETETETETKIASVKPLTWTELLRYSLDNLGDVEPGVAYRSAQPSASVLKFLERRGHLGHILNLRGDATNDAERDFVAAGRASLSKLSMSAFRPPQPRDILELIRVTLDARRTGKSFLIHCKAGADRSGVMVAAWRMLFQDATDRDLLKREALLFGHVHPAISQLYDTIDTFRPELFRPFIKNPELLDDELRIAELESHYFAGYALESGNSAVARGTLRVGRGKVDLLEGLAQPAQMATYGPRPGKSKGVREPIFVRALIFDNGARRVAIVSSDLMVMSAALSREVRSELQRQGLEIDDVLLTATHTHTSIGGYVDHWPSEFYILGAFQEENLHHLSRRIVAAVAEAQASLEPAKIGYGRAIIRASANRRLGNAVDPEVVVMRIDKADGKPLAVLVNYAAHPILEPNDGLISPDYPGLLCRKLDATHGFGMFLPGALGDLNARADPEKSGWITEGLAETVASRLFDGIQATLDGIDTRESVDMTSMTRTIGLSPFSVGLIPDLLFPIKWWLNASIDWPSRMTLQGLRIGDAVIVATSSEVGVRLGQQVKIRSAAPFTIIVAHANDYTGYAVTQVNYAKSKLDATSFPCANGPRHGRLFVDHAVEITDHLWPAEKSSQIDANSPSDEGRSGKSEGEVPASSSATSPEGWAEVLEQRRIDSLIDADPTLPQIRRRTFDFADSLDDFLRAELHASYVSDARGGTAARGILRETGLAARLRAPWDVRIDSRIQYGRANWTLPDGTTGVDEGWKDLELRAVRPWTLVTSSRFGNALRILPGLGLSMPTGNADPTVPYAFARGSGAWKPRAELGLEVVWDTYRSLSIRTLYETAIGDHAGRRPGDRIEAALGFAERHGIATLSLDLLSTLRFRDSRDGGLLPVDVSETSFDLALRPGISIRWKRQVETFFESTLGIARGGSAGGSGIGIFVGLRWTLDGRATK